MQISQGTSQDEIVITVKWVFFLQAPIFRGLSHFLFSRFIIFMVRRDTQNMKIVSSHGTH